MRSKSSNKKHEKKPQKTLVTLLLDRSGSMASVRDQTISSVNEWLGGLRASDADIRLSMVLFDSTIEGMRLQRIHVARPISEVTNINHADYTPSGGTPLIDAAFTTIQAVRDSLKGRNDTKVVIAIQTDGQELNSIKHTWAQLRGLIEECEGQGWQFQFMGAGINAYEQGARMGLGREKILSYGHDADQTSYAFRASAMNTSLYAAGTADNVGYSRAQKAAAGDRFDAAEPAFGAGADLGLQAVPYLAQPAVLLGGLSPFQPAPEFWKQFPVPSDRPCSSPAVNMKDDGNAGK